VRATGCSLAAKAPVWETGDRWFEPSHPDHFHCPQRRIAPAPPKRRKPGSSPGVGASLGVPQSGQSAGFGSRRSSVRIRPSRPRGLGQQLSRLLRRQETASASLASPTISPRSSNGRAPVLHTGDGGSIPSRGTARYASGEAPRLSSGRGSVRPRHAPLISPRQLRWTERPATNREVGGSTPSRGSIRLRGLDATLVF
jgi:hypothetical protein